VARNPFFSFFFLFSSLLPFVLIHYASLLRVRFLKAPSNQAARKWTAKSSSKGSKAEKKEEKNRQRQRQIHLLLLLEQRIADILSQFIDLRKKTPD